MKPYEGHIKFTFTSTAISKRGAGNVLMLRLSPQLIKRLVRCTFHFEVRVLMHLCLQLSIS